MVIDAFSLPTNCNLSPCNLVGELILTTLDRSSVMSSFSKLNGFYRKFLFARYIYINISILKIWSLGQSFSTTSSVPMYCCCCCFFLVVSRECNIAVLITMSTTDVGHRFVDSSSCEPLSPIWIFSRWLKLLSPPFFISVYKKAMTLDHALWQQSCHHKNTSSSTHSIQTHHIQLVSFSRFFLWLSLFFFSSSRVMCWTYIYIFLFFPARFLLLLSPFCIQSKGILATR